jgi:hypothetical protein
MNVNRIRTSKRTRQRGSSLFIVAAAIVTLVGLMGIGIDLVALYLGKSEAQRAADAAALAGATQFVSSGFTSGLVTQATVQTLATNQAVVVGKLNLVGGATPTIPNGNVTFDFSHAGDLDLLHEDLWCELGEHLGNRNRRSLQSLRLERGRTDSLHQLPETLPSP